jgi:hypothetical protein
VEPSQLPYLPRSSQPPGPQPHRQKRPVLLTASIVVVALLVLGGGYFALLRLLHTASTGISAQPTATPLQRARGDNAIFAPTVGGTIDDFQRQYGKSSDSHGLRYVATIAGQQVQITLAVDDPSQSLDGYAHVTDVEVQSVDFLRGSEPWSATTATAIAKTFLPADARFQRAVTNIPVGNGNAVMSDYVYYSSGMTTTFTPGAFTNGAGDKRVPVGTVHYFCQALPPVTSGYDWCVVTIGTY